MGQNDIEDLYRRFEECRLLSGDEKRVGLQTLLRTIERNPAYEREESDFVELYNNVQSELLFI